MNNNKWITLFIMNHKCRQSCKAFSHTCAPAQGSDMSATTQTSFPIANAGYIASHRERPQKGKSEILL